MNANHPSRAPAAHERAEDAAGINIVGLTKRYRLFADEGVGLGASVRG